MNVTINIPDIGEGEFEVTEILVKVGDMVRIEQSLITIEGNKASIEIPSPYNGIVEDILIITGNKVKTGFSIMVFKTIDKNINIDENQQTSLISNSNKQKCEDQDDLLISKITEEIKYTKDSEIKKIENNENNDTYVHASPLVRRLAYKFGIDLSKIKGMGKKNRILKECIHNHIKQAITFFELSSNDNKNHYSNLYKVNHSSKNISNINNFNNIEEIKLSTIQKISGNRLSNNWVTIPHVTHFDKIDITNLEEFRNKQNIEIKKKDPNIKINLLAFIMKAVNHALIQMPRFNSSLSSDLQKLILKKYINIGIAVDTPKGLLVPVFKNIDKKSVLTLSMELINISQEAIKGKLTAEDMQDGTFTISSLGGIGTKFFTPIINAPEVAILGISKFSIEPFWNGEKFLSRLMLPVSLSFDHRVIDGADGARFLNLISNILTDIRLLII
ncbi:dihydrolipoamide acetyltransferase [Candidatus Pantoea edessiphila]|uniref:Dihydrolipoamide acetyltransferase component of pyruvate dehydrogenase complex n=1 Tax=Candidatus Pantoea edessiphila TaxID=2044610 RepID=A0A2P5SY56_9GAMM|nr:2-oxo acid dehydrogenase subunit E2 [Candidatus Pantoea edessiphila]MBK4775581.1 dihydrolipoamide acetyltransferase [Pantoea sp. Edef]PPI87233.1 dihydrolipoamide acetyltransferase [Candidatus Pantoea edessiphila]